MAKYCGMIGFAEMQETAVDVWENVITERKYYGDIVRNFSQNKSSDKLNDDVDISNSISIVADPYINQKLHAIKYVTFMGTKWKVTNVEVQFPRLILSVGGIYND